MLRFAIPFFLIAVNQWAAADDANTQRRFAIVQAASRTLLLDEYTGTTWVLIDSPNLRWHKIAFTESVESERKQPNDEPIVSSPLKLISEAVDTVNAGQKTLVRVRVDNPTSNTYDHVLLTLSITGGQLISVTGDNTVESNVDSCTWRVERIAPGDTRVLEAQVMFGKDAVGQTSKFSWRLREPSGAMTWKAHRIVVTESP
ncbi:hypothetical protein [Novipirellula caenicola]|uniref:DUF11 domain-containing protein n=1 Tax=Novipirellula caenicola TaxID=1536901 RepID=A0ABP9VMI7_9BACT